MASDAYLIWDFDGTLATRSGGWAGTLCETVAATGGQAERDAVAPHLRSGFPWHTPDVGFGLCSDDEWWERLFPVLENALVEVRREHADATHRCASLHEVLDLLGG